MRSKTAAEKKKRTTRTAGKAIAVREAARRRLYVHVGMHKTGTTSIQYALHNSADQLHKCKILYPLTGRHPVAHVQHNLLFLALSPAQERAGIFAIESVPDCDDLFSQLISEIEASGCETVVISAENLWTLDADAVDRFAKYFADFDIVPIFFLRRMSDLIESLYLTNSRIGVTDVDAEVLGLEFWLPFLGFDVRQFVRRWAKISHNGRTFVHSYDNTKTDSIEAFREIIGIPEGVLFQDKYRYNPTQSVMTEFIRLVCNRYGISRQHREGLAAQIGLLSFESRLTLMPQNVRSRFDQEYFEQLNELVNADYTTPTDVSKWVLTSPEPPIYLDGLLSALFVIGRSIDADNRLRSKSSDQLLKR